MGNGDYQVFQRPGLADGHPLGLFGRTVVCVFEIALFHAVNDQTGAESKGIDNVFFQRLIWLQVCHHSGFQDMQIPGFVNQQDIELCFAVIGQVPVRFGLVPDPALADHDACIAAFGEVVAVNRQNRVGPFDEAVTEDLC